MIFDILRMKPRTLTCRFGFDLMPGDGFGGFPWRSSENEIRQRFGSPILESDSSDDPSIAYVVPSEFGPKEVVRWYEFGSSGLIGGSNVGAHIHPHEFEECLDYIIHQLSFAYGDVFQVDDPRSDVNLGWWAGADTRVSLAGNSFNPQTERSRIEVAFNQISALAAKKRQLDLFSPQVRRDTTAMAQHIFDNSKIGDPYGFGDCKWESSLGQVIERMGKPDSRGQWPDRPECEIIGYTIGSGAFRYITNYVFKRGELYKGSYMVLRQSYEAGWNLIWELKKRLVSIFGDEVVHRRQEDLSLPQGTWFGFVWESEQTKILLQIKSPRPDYPHHTIQLDFAPLSILE